MSEIIDKLKSLYELQLIDKDLIESIQEVKRIERDESPIQKKYKKYKSQLDDIDADLKPIEDDIKELQDKNSKLATERAETEDKLFGSAAGDHKTLQAYQQKREQLVGLMKTAEDEILKLQNEMTNIRIRRGDIEDQLKEIKDEYEQVLKEREKIKEEHSARIIDLKEKRKKFRTFSDKSLLSEYQRLQKENNGIAIASVDDGVCTGCFVELDAATKQRLGYHEDIVYCQRCGRILIDDGSAE